MQGVRKGVFRLILALAICWAMIGCGSVAPGYRYRLTLAVQTPEGIRRASNVVQVTWLKWGPDNEFRDPALNGEALYLDLGTGHRPLVALLKKRPTCPVSAVEQRDPRHWDGYEPTRLLATLQGVHVNRDILEVVHELSHPNEPYPIAIGELPELVTFADPSDPQSILPVDPHNLEATLGNGVSWASRTLELTDAMITEGIQKRLPWLNAQTPMFKLAENGPTRFCSSHLTPSSFKHPM